MDRMSCRLLREMWIWTESTKLQRRSAKNANLRRRAVCPATHSTESHCSLLLSETATKKTRGTAPSLCKSTCLFHGHKI